MTRRDFYQYKPYKTYFYTNKLFLEAYIVFARNAITLISSHLLKKIHP
jgi:hypothetical protein